MSAQQPTPSPIGRRTTAGARAVAIVVLVVGAVTALGTAGQAAASTLAAAAVRTTTASTDASAVESIAVDVSAGVLRVEFADVPRVELAVTGAVGADRWTLRTQAGVLTVRSPDAVFSPWTLFGSSAGNGTAVLRLPSALRGLDTTLGLSAGELTATGHFGKLRLTTSAGRLSVDGSADSVEADVSAGTADLTLAGARTASLAVSAGQLTAALRGPQPESMTLHASAGQMRVTVPAGPYDVSAQAGLGQFDNRVGSTPGAANTVRVDVSAGRIVLQPDR